jgi:outer membrane protein assembly factor BamB
MRSTAKLFAVAGTVVVLAGAATAGCGKTGSPSGPPGAGPSASGGAGSAVATAPRTAAGAQTSGDWRTYLNNVARTGYNSAETVVTPATARNLTQLWADRGGGGISAEPIQFNGVVYYGSWDGHERAVNAATGAQLWSSPFLGQLIDSNCDPSTLGVGSTATVGTIRVNGKATQTVFVGGGHGTFYALSASTGAVIWSTPLGFSTQRDRFLWSSPLLYNGSIYEGVASCGNGRASGEIARLDAATGKVQHILHTAPSGCLGASIWGSATVDTATGDIYFGTGNNAGSCTEPFSTALVQINRSLNVLSKWQVPASQLPDKDSDFGTTPTLFTATISGVVHQMIGLQNKNGIYYAFDRSAISKGPLWQKRMSVGGVSPETGRGDISPSAWDGTHLLVGGGITTIGGAKCQGSIRDLQPATGNTVWVDCLQSGPLLGAVIAAPGVAFFGAGNTAYAVSTSTGAILWRHQDTSSSSNFWGAPAISNGHVYFGNLDGTLYAFDT